MTYPTLPLADVPGFRPDGPVMVSLRPGDDVVATPEDFAALKEIADRPALLCDPTGCRSLAVAIGAACGMDTGGGVSVDFDSEHDVCIETGADWIWFTARNVESERWHHVPALSTIDPTAEHARALALAAVARVVLGVSRG